MSSSPEGSSGAEEPPLAEKDTERFFVKVDRTDPEGCWLWQAATDRDGYGLFKLAGRKWRAHRVAALLDGRDPRGKVVRHTCDNPSCVNPAHLKVGTQKENMRDRTRRGRNGQAKLDPEQVRRIRASDRPSKALARKYDVSASNIREIRTGRSWKHVE